MTRLWTLQEGILAKSNLYIACANGLKNLYDMVEQTMSSVRANTVLFPEHGRGEMRSEFLAYQTLSGADHMAMLPQTRHRRKNTKIQDEASCLATNTGVDIESLLQKQQLYLVFRLIKTLSGDLMFAPGPQRTLPRLPVGPCKPS